ncbi:MAG: YfbU family protein [Acidobacteriota bacterium]
MGQLTVTLPEELEDEVREKVRQGKYGSVSDFARDAFKNELTMRPSYWERFIAVHVLENNKMLKQLTDDQNWGSDELLEAMRRGYTNRYADAHNLVYTDELSHSETDFVQDVLDMYAALQHGYDENGKGDPKLAKDVLIEGFDGNAGDGYLGFTNFLVDNGRFAHVRPLDKIPHLNSHSSHVAGMYRRMLVEYKTIKASQDRFEYKALSLDQIKRILDAQVHPENRK